MTPSNVRRALIVSVLYSAAFAGCAQRDAKLAVGDQFPEFELHTLDGASASTADYRGRPVLINVWATWCAPCRKEMPALERLAQALAAEKANVRVIGVAVDEDDHVVRELLIKMGVTFPNYLDPGQGAMKDALALESYPQTFLVGDDGRVRGRIEGGREWDQRDMRIWLRERLGADFASANTK